MTTLEKMEDSPESPLPAVARETAAKVDIDEMQVAKQTTEGTISEKSKANVCKPSITCASYSGLI